MVDKNGALLFDGMKKLIMYDSKKAGAFNAFFNLTKKVSSDLEMRTANTWDRRAKSQAESVKELVTDVERMAGPRLCTWTPRLEKYLQSSLN